MWLGTFLSMACSSCFSDPLCDSPDSSLLHLSILHLIVPPIFSVWLLTNQLFIKPIRETNLYSAQKDYFTSETRTKKTFVWGGLLS